MKKIGIVGGGQLGRMLAFEAKKMGMYVAIVDPTPQSPAGQVSDFQILGDYKDTSATKKLAKISDVVTIDAEFVNDEILQKLEDQGKSIHPSSQTIKIIKDKFSQKKFLKTCKIPTAEFIEIENEKDILKAGEKFGYPFLLKARTDAYDGKGNFVVSSKNKIQKFPRDNVMVYNEPYGYDKNVNYSTLLLETELKIKEYTNNYKKTDDSDTFSIEYLIE